MQRIHDEYFAKFQRSGCVIEGMSYAYFPEQDRWLMTLVLNHHTPQAGDCSLQVILHDPCRIHMEHIENRQQIPSVEMVDHADGGYAPECRYRIYDYEDGLLDVYFALYELTVLPAATI